MSHVDPSVSSSTSPPLPILTPEDRAEIRENRTRIGLHTDDESERCYCPKCIHHRNQPQLQSTQTFVEQMLAHRFKDTDNGCTEVPTTSFIDDVLFIWGRVNELAEHREQDFQAISKLIRDGGPFAALPEPSPSVPYIKFDDWRDELTKARYGDGEPITSDHAIARIFADVPRAGRPLRDIAITETPDHWFPSYWRNTRVVPRGAHFHYQLLDEIEKVELNHDLPSGGTQTYSFERTAASVLAHHWVDARFEGTPYLIDDTSATFEQESPAPVPQEWLSPKIQIEIKRGKHLITNVRCRVCGAVNKHKYPKQTCKVDSDYLCNRPACVRTRKFKTPFDQQRLHIGYRLSKLFAPAIDISLLNWVRGNEHNESDPNLKCDLRYDLDRRGRKGISATTDYEEDVTPPAAIRTTEITDFETGDLVSSLGVRYAEEIFHATPVASSDIGIKTIEYDKSIHRLIGSSFEERRHVPNYNCFTARQARSLSPVRLKKPYDFNIAGCQLRSWVEPAFIIQGTIPYRIKEYRDPTVSKLDELKVRNALKAKFKEAGLKWYDPNNLHSNIITLWRETTGADDETLARQLAKIEKQNRHGSKIATLIEDIYLRKKSRKQVAKEKNTTVAAIKQKVYRDLNKPLLSEDDQWLRASGDCKQDGVYAVATVYGKPRAYLLLAATEFKSSHDENYKTIEDGLHNAICDILERRAKKGRIGERELKAVYRELYDEFQRLGWRMLFDGKWYGEDQQLVALCTT